MRKVIYSEYVQNGIDEVIGSHSYSRKPHYDLEEKGEALFLQWGINYEELETGVGSFSTAIIELGDGTVKNISAEHVRFISGDIEAKEK